MDTSIVVLIAILFVGFVIVAVALMRSPRTIPISVRRRRIATLDLAPVREKAMSRNGWDEAKARLLEDEYRDFLILLAENDGKTVSPWSHDLDLMWHEHLLDTKRYATDCKWIFGRFIEHDPHIDKRPSHHEETKRTTMVLREAQLQAREERKRRAVAEGSTSESTSTDGFDLAQWGCAATVDDRSSPHHGHDSSGHHDASGDSTSHHGDSSSHSHGSSCGGGGHSDGGGGGHSCGGHSCGGHGCGGGGCGGH